jgi:hypothetical protein
LEIDAKPERRSAHRQTAACTETAEPRVIPTLGIGTAAGVHAAQRFDADGGYNAEWKITVVRRPEA